MTAKKTLFIKFHLYGKIKIKKRNQLIPQPTFSLIPVKIQKNGQKLDFDPQNKE